MAGVLLAPLLTFGSTQEIEQGLKSPSWMEALQSDLRSLMLLNQANDAVDNKVDNKWL